MSALWSIRRPAAIFLASLALFTGIFATSSVASAAVPKDATTAKAAQSPIGERQGWKTKLAAQAIRSGGPFVSRLVSRVSPRAGSIFKRNTDRIADWIERVGDVQEGALAIFLMKLGIPPGEAWNMARYIVLVFGL